MSDFRNKAILAAVEAEVGLLRTQLDEAQAENERLRQHGLPESVATWNDAAQRTLNRMCEVYRDAKVEARQAQAENERRQRAGTWLLWYLRMYAAHVDPGCIVRSYGDAAVAALRGEPSQHGGKQG